MKRRPRTKSFSGSSTTPTPKGPVLRPRVVSAAPSVPSVGNRAVNKTHTVLVLAEVGRKLEERESTVSHLQRAKTSFSQNVEELKKQLEEENKVSHSLLYTAQNSFSVQPRRLILPLLFSSVP